MSVRQDDEKMSAEDRRDAVAAILAMGVLRHCPTASGRRIRHGLCRTVRNRLDLSAVSCPDGTVVPRTENPMNVTEDAAIGAA